MSIRTRTAALAGILVLAAGALAACDPGGGASPAPSGSAAPTVSPTTGPQLGAEPGSRYDVTCPELAPEAALASAHSAPVAATDPFEMASEPDIPTAAVVLQLGGIACEWTNGAPMLENHQVSSGFVGTRIAVLPDAAAEWTKFTDTYGAGDSHLNCYDTGVVVDCDLNELVAGSWIEVTIYGVNATVGAGPDAYAAAVTPLLDAVRMAIAGATVTAAVDHGSFTMPAECTTVISGEEFGAGLGLGTTTVGGPHGGWSLDASGRLLADAQTCIYFYPESDLAAGIVRWLPGAAWAAEESMAVATFPSEPADAEVAGADAAWVRCEPANGACTVDATLSGTWLQVTVSADDTGGLPAPTDRRAAALATMETVIASVTIG